MKLRVLLVDDHAVVRQGLRAYLELQPDIEVCGESGSAVHAAELAGRIKPDVALVDMVMPGGDGIEATRGIRSTSPATQVVILTSLTDEASVRPALEAGAVSYQLKDVAGAELVECIRSAARGESRLHPRIAASLVRTLRGEGKPDPLAQLSARERDVLLLIADGLSNQVIAERLGIGEATVKTHVGNLLAKLDLADRTQAAVWAWRHRLVAG
ncbi:MAG: response regulator transcription factor [Rhodanobacteraceae bacterium]|nr:response regulator transcription factor [Rhodanobacteraceae bacterium]